MRPSGSSDCVRVADYTPGTLGWVKERASAFSLRLQRCVSLDEISYSLGPILDHVVHGALD